MDSFRQVERGSDILWDAYGVPHIFAEDDAGLFHAFGWAQMKSHANLLLRLYGQARGRAAQYWGTGYLRSDQWVAMMGIPERALEWGDAQDPSFRNCLNAFAAGINEYARAHPECIAEDVRVVLPVEAIDVLAHSQRVLNFSFVVDPDSVARLVSTPPRLGSNAWAIAPSRSASGHAMLLTNPHMPWGDMFVCYEAHLNAQETSAYGIALVGLPVLTMAFNDCLGWSHTVNTYRGWTLYELELAAEGYRVDGELRAFETKERLLNVRQDDGTPRQEALVVRHSVHGPVVEKDDRAFALRVAGLNRPRALEQWWKMSRATDLSEFETALQEMQLPMLTVIYADRAGHIMHLFNGQVPVRHQGDAEYWAGVVPGNSSAYIWTETHGYHELPRVVDPPSGWLQNANDPPWTTTFPPGLHPDHYPPYFAPRGPMSLRAQRSACMLMEQEKLSFEDVVRHKYSTLMELPSRVIDELVAAARSGSPTAQRAAEVLHAWDRRADADSRGAVLFVFWSQAMDHDRMFRVPWNEAAPLATPYGLADPAGATATIEAVAARVEARYGDLAVKWGDVFRLHSGRVSLRAIAADKVGVFPELWFLPTLDGRFFAVGGDCYTAVVEFCDPVRAMVLTIYGNATQPSSALPDAQLELFARKELRPAWLTTKDITEHLLCHDRLTSP